MTSHHSLLTLLQLPADTAQEAVQEVYDQKLFDAKQDLLQKFAVPSLLRKKIKLLEPLAQLEKSDVLINHTTPFGSTAITDKIEFLEHYERKMSELRLALTSASSFAALCQVASALALQQDYYMMLFTLFFSAHYSALPEEVNTRDMIDTGPLLVQLKAGDPDDKMAWAIEKELARIQKIHQLL